MARGELDLFTALVDSVMHSRFQKRAAQTISDRLHGLVGTLRRKALWRLNPHRSSSVASVSARWVYTRDRLVSRLGALDLEA